MYPDSSVNSLEHKLKAKKNQQVQFQNIINRYNYALTLINNEIDQLTKELSGNEPAKRKWYSGNDWDAVIANIIAEAGCPLTKEEIEVELELSNFVPDTTTNPKQYMYQKILHAQKREAIVRCNIPGDRRLYYCLPEWLDESGSLKEQFLLNAVTAVMM